MRKILTAVLVMIFFGILLVVILYKVLSPSSSSTTDPVPVPTTAKGAESQDAAQFVKSFYEWYLSNFARDPLFPYPENRTTVLSPWISNDFLANWDLAVSQMEMNPVLLTADDPASWGRGITARTVSQSSRSSEVYVTIGSGPSLHAYTVVLNKDADGAWKIVSVASTI